MFSSGKIYEVTLGVTGTTCTCPAAGRYYRGKCGQTGETTASSSSTSKTSESRRPSEIHINQLRLYAAAAVRLGLKSVSPQFTI